MFENIFVAVKMFIVFQKIIWLFFNPYVEILERNKRDIRYSIKKPGKIIYLLNVLIYQKK